MPAVARPVARPAARPAAAAPEKQDDGLTVITPPGIACFVHVWEPHAFPAAPGEQQKPAAYGLILVFDAATLATQGWKDVQQTALRAARAKFGADVQALSRGKRWSWGWREAEDYAKHGQPFEAPNKMILLKSNSAPGVVDARAKPIMKQQEFYPGCWARVSMYAHAYQHPAGNLGITFLLNNVQKVRDDTPLAGGRMDPTKEFGVVEGAAGGDDDDLFGTGGGEDDIPF